MTPGLAFPAPPAVAASSSFLGPVDLLRAALCRALKDGRDFAAADETDVSASAAESAERLPAAAGAFCSVTAALFSALLFSAGAGVGGGGAAAAMGRDLSRRAVSSSLSRPAGCFGGVAPALLFASADAGAVACLDVMFVFELAFDGSSFSED